MKLELQNENILKIVAQQEKLITNIQQKLIEETAQKQQYEKKFMEQQEKQKQCEILLADLQKTLNNEISSRKKLEDETRKQNDAINDLNGIIHNQIKKQNISDAMETMDEETTVFIQNIPYDAKVQDIKRVFSKFGDVKDVRILKESVYDREFSKGVGFVEFMLEDSAIEAINDSENIEIKNRKIKVEFAIPEGSRKGSILNAFETRKGPDNGLKKFL